VVQTQPNAESKACTHLARQGFETYLPRFIKSRRHARRTEKVLAPLFPRYLFINVDMATQRWRAIQSTIGVSRLVCNGTGPASLPIQVVATLKSQEGASGAIDLDVRPRFAFGEQLRIVDGVFANCLGLFDGMADRERIAVLLDLLGRKVRVLVEDLSVTAA
jgi:transcriptional antiterminator RfaH